MHVINWLELQPLPADLDALHEHLRAALPLRRVCQLLVETTLRAYPWTGRADLLPSYHPSQTYKQGQKIALLISDSQSLHPTVWQFAQVQQVKLAANRPQGRFQVLTLEIRGRQIQMAGGIVGASYPEPDPSSYTPDDLAWLAEWVSTTYAVPLQATLKKLIKNGQVRGELAGEIFIPERVSALSLELLHPIFAGLPGVRPWFSLEEIYNRLPDLSPLKHETVLALLHTSLKASLYRPLGAGRWTTPEHFARLSREVPLGLPTARIHSSTSVWTKRDGKELAGYDRKFMPKLARHALEELGMVEKPLEPDESLWRPPKDSLQLPALNYLHVTQAYFPVGSVLRAFAPGVQLVFVQWISGDHQPFLLDREHGLLKAVNAEELSSKILKDDIPAGTALWLEYEGNEKYRIAPRPLPFKRMVPCKLAYLEDGRLHIQHTQISMAYEGQPSLFKANLRFEEIKNLLSEAGRVDLSVRDAMIYAIQELSATDPDHRAHRMDILNAVFLQRICSPGSAALLLYTQPCFEPLGSDYFRYKPTPEKPLKKTPKRKDRLSKLWDHLLSDAVPPHPASEKRSPLDVRYPVLPAYAPALEVSSLLREPDAEPGIPVAAIPLFAVEEDATGLTERNEERGIETLLVSNDQPDPFTPTDAAEPVSNPWSDSLDRLLHGLEELANHEPSALPVEETTPETEAFSDTSIETTHEESLSFSSPFRWEPKPAWLDVPVPQKHPSPDTVDARRFAYKPRIPIRPLHKQPLYRRIFFYLRGWLSRTFRKAA
jgi:hypothetical protein